MRNVPFRKYHLTPVAPIKEENGGGGFFYELFLRGDARLTDADLLPLAAAAKRVIKVRRCSMP